VNITQHPANDWLELRLAGRLDATWAEHVSNTIESAVRSGSHQIVLNFAHVEYLSSLGIRVLLQHYKRLQSVNGSLMVTDPSVTALSILKATGLASLLMGEAVLATTEPTPIVTSLTRAGAAWQVYPQAVTTPLRCTAVGEPGRLAATCYTDSDCRALTFPQGAFGLGLGAFGADFADCRDRFGEFLAAGGCAMTLPTNDSHAQPDYVLAEGELVPRVETLYALTGAGDFPAMIRFDSLPDGAGKIGLSALVDSLLEIVGGEAVAFVVLAEAAGLVGATLRRSPATGPVSLELPDVRDCLSFSTERVGEHNLALLVGVAARGTSQGAAAFLRPLAADGGAGIDLLGHVHAALFPFRPVQRGELPFAGAVANMLANATPITLMHVMPDTRPFEGVGETELVRGACWAGPLGAIRVESSAAA
jgi:anti-anti-sigma factor